MLNIKKTKQEDWVNREDAAKALGLKKSTFNKYVCLGKIPPHAINEGVVTVFHLPTLKGLTN